MPAGNAPLDPPVLPADGRWQRGQVVAALYLADTEKTAAAEWHRWLSEVKIPLRATLPRDLWKFTLDVEVADLSTEGRLAAHGLPLPVPDRRSWGAFQAVGEQVRREGCAGLIAPSAARPSALVVCLFWVTPVIEGVQPLPPPDRWDDPPAAPDDMAVV